LLQSTSLRPAERRACKPRIGNSTLRSASVFVRLRLNEDEASDKKRWIADCETGY
jgi:hypothetical protein